MKLQFSKMHGQGNDFMVVDAVRQSIQFTPELVRKLSHRQMGIGFDQLLVVEKTSRDDVDFRYRIFNSDGGEVQQCGNGARCFVRFAKEVGLTSKDVLRVETINGLIELRDQGQGVVTVNMGEPRFTPSSIPFTGATSPAISYELNISGEPFNIATLSMGNPHAVVQVSDVDRTDVATLGLHIQNSGYFPEGVNVGFLQIVDRANVKLRVYERGAGETLACGSGACAAVVAGIRWGLLVAKVHVKVLGGALSIEWHGDNSPVLMSGGTATVYRGEIDI
jgi:diaminopimelate epimerase